MLTCEYGPIAGGAVGQIIASLEISIFELLFFSLDEKKGLNLLEGVGSDFPKVTLHKRIAIIQQKMPFICPNSSSTTELAR